MKILELRFHNLNSLTGNWHIDFTEPAYVNEGLFVISGPTGSGKSTILDALCLALYGTTPRLGRITQSRNEIMSRGQGACGAELSFETASGHYRATWAQHRARQRADGKLQAPRHELVRLSEDGSEAEILASQYSEVEGAVEAVTGLDFERFTRSMLLAQGAFAAFLNASADERAPILQQITGTEIYEDLSKLVHERNSGERQKLEQLEATLHSMTGMAAEERAALQSDYEVQRQRTETLAAQLETTGKALGWLQQLAALKQERARALEAVSEIEQAEASFAPMQQRLKAAQATLEQAGQYSALAGLREAQSAETREAETTRQRVEELTTSLEQHEREASEAKAALAKAQGARDEAAPILRAVRALDNRIAAERQRFKELELRSEESAGALRALRERQQADEASLGDDRARLTQAQRYLEEAKADAGLVQDLVLIRRLVAERGERRRSMSERQQLLRQAERARSEHQATYNAARQQLDEAEQALAPLADHYQLLERAQQDRESLDALQAEGRRLNQQRADEEALRTKLNALAEARDARAAVEKQLEQIERDATAVDETIAEQQRVRAAAHEHLSLLESNRFLAARVRDLEAERAALREGEACPLCGSLDHPYASHTPLPSEDEAALTEAKARVEALEQALSESRIARSRLEERRGLLTQQVETHATTILALEEETEAHTPLEVEARLAALDAQLADHSARLEAWTEATQNFDRARRAYERARSERDSRANALREKENTYTSAQQRCSSLRETIENLDEAQTKGFEQLRTALEGYGLTVDRAMDDEGELLQQLEAREGRYQAQHRLTVELAQRIAGLENRIDQRGEGIATATQTASDDAARLQTSGETITGLEAQRREAFGAIDADAEEQRLERALADASQGERLRSDRLRETSAELNANRTKLSAHEQAIAERAASLEEAEASFAAGLAAAGFTDEAGWRSARMRDDERRALEQEARQLLEDGLSRRQQLQRISTQLEAERAKALSDEDEETLSARQRTLSAEHRTLLERLGGMRQRLEDDDALAQKRQAQENEVAAQRELSRRWRTLHELIGSADGKKFRNFAQGLTLDLVVQQANAQLSRLSDRYLLKRSEALSLELDVIDLYQGGIERPTSNLSGGESFIVSLALALGLSRMASRRVRIDSLFLDEGFGSLDEATLNTALEAIASLQQEGGRLIGIISHVQILKERIRTRIDVIPETGGRSRLAGPGVTRS